MCDGVVWEDVPPSPNVHCVCVIGLPAAVVVVFVKTALELAHGLDTVKLGTGVAYTLTTSVSVAEQPFIPVEVSDTLYIPGVE